MGIWVCQELCPPASATEAEGHICHLRAASEERQGYAGVNVLSHTDPQVSVVSCGVCVR